MAWASCMQFTYTGKLRVNLCESSPEYVPYSIELPCGSKLSYSTKEAGDGGTLKTIGHSSPSSLDFESASLISAA